MNQFPALRRASLLLIAIAVLAVSATPLSTLSPQPDGALAAITQQAAASESVGVIIRAAGDTDSLVAAIEAAGGTVERQYTIIPAVQATVSRSALATLAADAAVAYISLDATIEMATSDEVEDPLAPSPDSVFAALIRATDVWAAGITGSGVGIAVIDTGINTRDANFKGRIVATTSMLRGPSSDKTGHGTHVAGIAAGDGKRSDGRFTGVAPGANLIAVKVGNLDGVNVGDAIAGMEWVLENASRYNIRVVNLSFTSTVAESYLVSPLDAAVEQLWLNGIVVVAAAGNRGTDAFAADHPPANDPLVITVGAFSDEATLDSTDDFLKSWSSRGLSRDGFEKPEVVAPGSRLIATVGFSRAELIQLYPQNVIEGTYFQMGGTSASAPVVAGVVALMIEANPGLTPDQVKARIVAGADPLVGSLAPQIDAWDAVFGGDAGLANQGIQLSLWIDPATGLIQNEPASLDSITWDSITWDSITWDSITWDSITWDSITWDSITWDSITWDSITWDSIVIE